MSDARLSETELLQACSLFDSKEIKKLHVQTVTGLGAPVPEAPKPDVQDLIEKRVAMLRQPVARKPWWCYFISRNRDTYRGCAIGLEPDGDIFWLLLYAKQNPHLTTFMQLRRRPTVLDLTNDEDPDHEERRVYDYLRPEPIVRSQATAPIPHQDCELFVRRDLRFKRETVVSPHRAETWESIAAFLEQNAGEEDAHPKTERPRVKKEGREQWLEDNPWLSDDEVPGGKRKIVPTRPPGPRKRRHRRGPCDSSADSSGDTSEPDPPIPIEDGPAVPEAPKPLPPPLEDDPPNPHEELAKIREECCWDEGIAFYTRVDGGEWTMLHKGKAADQICGYARDAVKPWCILYEFPRQKSFAFGLYGRPAATELAREYCRRGDYFYSLYLNAEEDEFAFTAAHVAAYPESPAFIDFMCSLEMDDPAFDAGLEVRALVPYLGEV